MIAVMNRYAPASSVGWLDFDGVASDRVSELLRALDEPTTLDALGLGTIRDGFSDLLSPGTSTVQTKLRYFLFIPWICQGIERDRVRAGDFVDRLRRDEVRLIDCLRHLGANRGVIGFTAGRRLKRMPSETYWGGLGAWGVRRLDLSLVEYGKRASALGRLAAERDDDRNVVRRTPGMWAAVPGPPPAFLDAEIDFVITRAEAEFLLDHWRRHHPESLLAEMAGVPVDRLQVGYPWQVDLPTISWGLRTHLHHARCFSELTAGVQRVYNVLLARRARAEFSWDTDELEQAELAALAEWATKIEDRAQELRQWFEDIDAFWAQLSTFTVHPRTREFITWTVERSLQDAAGLVDDPDVAARVARREFELKGQRARLVNRGVLQSWNQTAFGGQLNYRWPTVRSYLSDVAQAMGAAN